MEVLGKMTKKWLFSSKNWALKFSGVTGHHYFCMLLMQQFSKYKKLCLWASQSEELISHKLCVFEQTFIFKIKKKLPFCFRNIIIWSTYDPNKPVIYFSSKWKYNRNIVDIMLTQKFLILYILFWFSKFYTSSERTGLK